MKRKFKFWIAILFLTLFFVLKDAAAQSYAIPGYPLDSIVSFVRGVMHEETSKQFLGTDYEAFIFTQIKIKKRPSGSSIPNKVLTVYWEKNGDTIPPVSSTIEFSSGNLSNEIVHIGYCHFALGDSVTWRLKIEGNSTVIASGVVRRGINIVLVGGPSLLSEVNEEILKREFVNMADVLNLNLPNVNFVNVQKVPVTVSTADFFSTNLPGAIDQVRKYADLTNVLIYQDQTSASSLLAEFQNGQNLINFSGFCGVRKSVAHVQSVVDSFAWEQQARYGTNSIGDLLYAVDLTDTASFRCFAKKLVTDFDWVLTGPRLILEPVVPSLSTSGLNGAGQVAVHFSEVVDIASSNFGQMKFYSNGIEIVPDSVEFTSGQDMTAYFSSGLNGGTISVQYLGELFFQGCEQIPLFSLNAPYSMIFPIEFTAFVVEDEGLWARLKWSTQNPTSVSHFEIERSLDGVLWETRGQVNWASGISEYYFQDSLFEDAERVYYRIRQIDTDGSVGSVSNIEVLQTQPQDISVHPNPANDYIVITPGWTKYFFQISDPAGRVYVEGIEEGGHVKTIDVSDLPSGIYYIVIVTSRGETASYKIIKL